MGGVRYVRFRSAEHRGHSGASRAGPPGTLGIATLTKPFRLRILTLHKAVAGPVTIANTGIILAPDLTGCAADNFYLACHLAPLDESARSSVFVRRTLWLVAERSLQTARTLWLVAEHSLQTATCLFCFLIFILLLSVFYGPKPELVYPYAVPLST